MTKLTQSWDGWPEQIPANVRRYIIQMLSWYDEAVAPSDELVATRVANVYLMGVNAGIDAANRLAAKTLNAIGRGR